MRRAGWIAVGLGSAALAAMMLAAGGGERKIEHRLERLYDSDDPQFRRSIGALLGPPIVEGNAVQALQNGDAIFGAMLAEIRAARRTITFETFIYWSESIGEEFAQALAERARAGVKVHVLLDWIGSDKLDGKNLAMMEDAGVQLVRFHKPDSWKLWRLNNRTHRKLLVVDGRVGFTGGVGIADQWRGNAQDADHWRDSHYRVEGPVVAQMQAVFIDNWIKATGRVLDGEAYFPALSRRGALSAQMFSSSPSGGGESMHLMYLMLITAARSSIRLSSAYFVPDKLAVEALAAAARRGVKVQIITPGGQIDSDTVRWASRALWGDLLAAGVEISEYQPTMYHCKVMVVDDRLVSVGSTNFDNRSFALNDEANLNVLDAGFATAQSATFEEDLRRSRRITLLDWQQRPWREKLLEQAAVLLRGQL